MAPQRKGATRIQSTKHNAKPWNWQSPRITRVTLNGARFGWRGPRPWPGWPPAIFLRDDIGGQAQPLDKLDDVKVEVELPPAMLHRSAGRVVMVIVVPAFAAGDGRHEPIVSALVARFIIAIAEDMAQ